MQWYDQLVTDWNPLSVAARMMCHTTNGIKNKYLRVISGDNGLHNWLKKQEDHDCIASHDIQQYYHPEFSSPEKIKLSGKS